MRRFFLSLPDFFSRRPDSSFILSDTFEPKDGTSALDRLVQGLRSDSWALVHLPYGGEVEVDFRSPRVGLVNNLEPLTAVLAPLSSTSRPPLAGDTHHARYVPPVKAFSRSKDGGQGLEIVHEPDTGRSKERLDIAT
jgi:hypothetical protein